MELAEFISNHWSDIIIGIALFFLITTRIIPPKFSGMEDEYYDTTLGKVVQNRKQSLAEAVGNFLFFTTLRSALVTVGFRGATTIIMFAVIIVELIAHKTISTNAVIISIVGILALHFEQLLESADEFTVWKLFSYKKKR